MNWKTTHSSSAPSTALANETSTALSAPCIDQPTAPPMSAPTRPRMSEMNMRYVPYGPDQRQSLIDFIAGDRYPFNGVPQPTREQAASWIDSGIYTEWFWIVATSGPVGVMHYQDASAIHAEVHMRLHGPFRGDLPCVLARRYEPSVGYYARSWT